MKSPKPQISALSVHPMRSTATAYPKLLDLSDRVLDLHLQYLPAEQRTRAVGISGVALAVPTPSESELVDP